MTKPIEDSTNAAAIRTALDVPTTADLTAVDDAAQAAADAAASKYTKPGTGIPASDLAAPVQTSLGKSDSAIQDLAGMTAKFNAGTAPEKAAFQSSVSGATGKTGEVHMAFVGDSITSYGTTSAWHQLACYLSNGIVAFAGRYATMSYTSKQILDEMLPLALASSVGSTHIGILAGRNDIGQAVPVATFLANVTAMVGAIRASGRNAAIFEITPSSIDTPTKILTAKFNQALRGLCSKLNVPLIRWYAGLVDKTTGGWLAGLNQDTTHPGPAGHWTMGTLAAGEFFRIYGRGTKLPFVEDNVALVGNSNPLMLTTSTNAYGTYPTGHSFRYGAGYSTAVGAGLYGNRWSITITALGGWEARSSTVAVTAGDVVEVTARVGVSGITGAVGQSLTLARAGQYTNNILGLLLTTQDTPADGLLVCARAVVPDGCTAVDVFAASGAAVGTTLWFEQLSVKNITALSAI